jgi:hypothetical protein
MKQFLALIACTLIVSGCCAMHHVKSWQYKTLSNPTDQQINALADQGWRVDSFSTSGQPNGAVISPFRFAFFNVRSRRQPHLIVQRPNALDPLTLTISKATKQVRLIWRSFGIRLPFVFDEVRIGDQPPCTACGNSTCLGYALEDAWIDTCGRLIKYPCMGRGEMITCDIGTPSSDYFRTHT